MRAITAIAICLWAGSVFGAGLNVRDADINMPSSSSVSRTASHSASNGKQHELGLGNAGFIIGHGYTRVYVRNMHFDKVIEEQVTTSNWTKDALIYGTVKKPEPKSNQILKIDRRGNDQFYSLAFNHLSNSLKVITDNDEEPMSKLYRPWDSSEAQWKFIYVDNWLMTAGKYQIISLRNNRALSMMDHTNQLSLVEPDTNDRKQLWDFRDAKTFQIVFYDNSAPCPSGPSNEYPTENTKCFAPDSSQRRASLGTCTGYLLCQPNCVWDEYKCPEGTFYNQKLRVCTSRENADCAAGVFGSEGKVVIKNAGNNLVLHDCQGCFGGGGFPTSSFVTGATRQTETIWNQVLIAKKRADMDYYTLAFDRVYNDEFKVLVGYERTILFFWHKDEIMSQSFKSFSSGIEWKIVPTSDSEKYQIVSVQTKKALAMTKRQTASWTSGAPSFYLGFQKPDQNNPDQLWTFGDVDTAYRSDGRGASSDSLSSSRLSSSSSEEMSNVGGNKCQSRHGSTGSSQKGSPTPNSQCYQEDILHKTSSPSSCKTYLECDSNDCIWREYSCSGSRFWNNAQKECVETQEQATCVAANYPQPHNMQRNGNVLPE